MITALAPLLVTQEPAHAQAIGTETHSCGRYLATKSDTRAGAEFVTWLTTFLTKFNMFNREWNLDATAHTGAFGMLAWLDCFCAAQPVLPFATASEAVLLDLKDRDRRARN